METILIFIARLVCHGESTHFESGTLCDGSIDNLEGIISFQSTQEP
jgi:hypothetical protein